MPLRDHFHPPISLDKPWEGFHSLWASTLVQLVTRHLPPQYFAIPTVRFAGGFEVDVATYEDLRTPIRPTAAEEQGGVATAVWAPPEPTMVFSTDMFNTDTFELLIYDESDRRRLVAAVEIVSPSNKDRPETRRAFVGKCADLIRQEVSVSIIDLVTSKHFNLYADLLDFIGQADPQFAANPSHLYAVTCRRRQLGQMRSFKAWAYPLALGEPLPTLPIWLTDDVAVPLELDAAYEATCRTVRLI